MLHLHNGALRIAAMQQVHGNVGECAGVKRKGGPHWDRPSLCLTRETLSSFLRND